VYRLTYNLAYEPGSSPEEAGMRKVRPSEDVRPLSEFRANAASVLRQVKGTKRPVILTVHGRSAAVLLDVEEYEDLVDQAEVLHDVRTAEKQLAKGQGLPHGKARTRILSRFRK